MNDHPERHATPRRALLVALFVLYLVLLTWTVLWKLAVPWIGAAALLPHPIKLIPFVAAEGAGASAPAEVIENVALFVPFGLYLGLLAPSWRWWNAIGIFAGASLLFEITQHLLSTGSFDTTDIITNTTGGVLGFAALALVRRRLATRTSAVAMPLMLAGTVLSLVAVGVVLAVPLHFAPRSDVVVTRQSPSR